MNLRCAYSFITIGIRALLASILITLIRSHIHMLLYTIIYCLIDESRQSHEEHVWSYQFNWIMTYSCFKFKLTSNENCLVCLINDGVTANNIWPQFSLPC